MAKDKKPDEQPQRLPPGEHQIAAVNRDGGVLYSAPIPPASEFGKYEAVLPGSADRILGMSERQSQHRHFLEKVVVIFDSIRSAAGLIAALVIVLAGMWAGVYLIINDKSPEGMGAILLPLATIVGAFLYQQKTNKKNN